VQRIDIDDVLVEALDPEAEAVIAAAEAIVREGVDGHGVIPGTDAIG
jgi:hypothetical protein